MTARLLLTLASLNGGEFLFEYLHQQNYRVVREHFMWECLALGTFLFMLPNKTFKSLN